eukprot:2123707-Pleurochrysis_carterae.AAC.1
MVSRLAFASHAYLRRARAPLPKFLDSRSRWLLPICERPFLEPPCRRASARAPALALSPPTIHGNRESDCKDTPAQACVEQLSRSNDQLRPRATLSGCSITLIGKTDTPNSEYGAERR